MQLGVLGIVIVVTGVQLVWAATQTIRVKSPHLVDGTLDFPYDIEFLAFPTDNFVPESLSGHIAAEPRVRRRTYARSKITVKNSDAYAFRSTQDQNFRHNDVLRLTMEYTDKEGYNRQRTSFEYIIRENQTRSYVIIFTNFFVNVEAPRDGVNGPSETAEMLKLDTSLLPPGAASLAEEFPTDKRPDAEWIDTGSVVNITHSSLPQPPAESEWPISEPPGQPQPPIADQIDESVSKVSQSTAAATKPTRTAAQPIPRRLLLTGKALSLVINSNATEIIGNIILGDLVLPHLVKSVSLAQFVPQGLLFEMSKPRDAVEILTQAMLLRDTGTWNYDIQKSDLEFIGVVAFARSAQP